MEVLSELGKQFHDNGMPSCDRVTEDNHVPYPCPFNNGIVYPVSMDHLGGTVETEDPTSTRHSSGCDDSGVFLEDLPYHPDTIPNLTQIDPNLDKFNPRKFLNEDVCQYSIDGQNGLDSDAEKSDDLGLASSSVDSADDLEGDLAPLTLKLDTSLTSKKTPPPVPPRKLLTNGKCEVKSDQNIVKPDLDSPLPVQNFQVSKVETDFSEDNLMTPVTQLRRHSDNFKWKSEECLRFVNETKWSQRANEKSISVKDRIAMFKEMESSTSNGKVEANLYRFPSESNVKSTSSPETVETDSDQMPYELTKTDNFSSLDKNTKWYSMYSLPSAKTDIMKADTHTATTPNAFTNNDPLIVPDKPLYFDNKTNKNIGPLKIDTEQPVYSEKPIVSSYPQTQLTNGKRYNYGLYNLSSIRTTDDLLKKNNGLLSIIDSRKQPLQKLKGLVIPDRPFNSSTSKALPTIVSNDSLVLNVKPEVDSSKDWKRSPLSAASYKTMSLPRTMNDHKAKTEPNYDASKFSEPMWKANMAKNNAVPKYSPAFKTRTLDYSHGVTSSLSPTPPSSVTSPLSPPPSSPSSICSSNASSATSVATMQQNVFQFSLSHSKPVTPVLPEKAIMSPPSLPSDIEYEGSSEDSSTSASPMTTKASSKRNSLPTLMYSSAVGPYCNSNQRSENLINFPFDVRNGSHESSEKSNGRSYTSSANNSLSLSDDSDGTSKSNGYKSKRGRTHDPEGTPRYTPGQNKPSKFSSRNELQSEADAPPLSKTKRDIYSNEVNTKTIMTNSASNFPLCHQETDNVHRGNTNGFLAASQEIQAIKFRAQPLTMNQVIRNSTNENASITQPKVSSVSKEDAPACQPFDRNGFSEQGIPQCCNAPTLYDSQKTYVSDYDCSQLRQPWLQSSDVIKYKRRGIDSEDEDDSHSSISHRTEDSRPTTDEYLSDATTDSFDKSLDPDLKPRRLSQQRVVLKASTEGTDSVQKFRALAEKWEHKIDATSPPPTPPVIVPIPRRESKPSVGPLPPSSSFLSSIINSTSKSNQSSNSSMKLPPSLLPRNKHTSETRNTDRRSSNSGTVGSEVSHRQRLSDANIGPSLVNKNSYETVWSDVSSKEPCLSAFKDVTDSVTNTDTSSNYLRGNIISKDKSNYTNGFGISPEFVDKQNPEESSSVTSKLQNKQPENMFKTKMDDSLIADKSFRSTATIEIKSAPSNSDVSRSQKDSLVQARDIIMDKPNSPMEGVKAGRSEKMGELELSWRNRASRSVINDLSSSRNISRSQTSLRDPLEHVRSHGLPSYLSSKNAKSVSVSDIRKAFESQCNQNVTSSTISSKPPPLPPRTTHENGVNKQNCSSPLVKQTSMTTDHKRLSSLDSTTSGDSDVPSPPRYESVVSYSSITRDPYGSVTSLASTTSLISPQELQQLIDEANQSLEESCGGKHMLQQQEIQVVVLHREVPAGSIGITLAGGADYEVKEITVHKIISGSLADRDGRLRKGDRVISINGRHLKGTTHREALDILKAPRPEVVLVISREKAEPPNGHLNEHRETKEHKIQKILRPQDEFCIKPEDLPASLKESIEDSSVYTILSIELQKDVTGLGFSIEGGKDSPMGDRPLLIKRIFKGGVADKDGQLAVGDEIISVNGQSVTSMTRTEAWNFLKKLPEEPIILKAKKRTLCQS